MNEWYLVVNDEGEVFYQDTSSLLASQEAERLAEENKGVNFTVFMAICNFCYDEQEGVVVQESIEEE